MTESAPQRRSQVLLALAAAMVFGLLVGSAAFWRPWADHHDEKARPSVASTVPATASTAPTLSSLRAAPPRTEGQQGDWREHHTWVCDTATGEVCGNWSPEAVTFACKAVASGADYTAGLKNMLMSRYGMSEMDAFFLGKEAMYSVSSGGHISTGGNADGPHPLCNGIVP